MKSNVLNQQELAKLMESYPSFSSTSKCVVYSRVLLSGVLYSSASYKRSGVTDDSVVCLEHGEIGTVQSYVSFCKEVCSCNPSKFCTHVIIVCLHPHQPIGIDDQATGATAKHVMQIGNSV